MTVQAILFDWTGTLAYLDRRHARDPVAAVCAEVERHTAQLAPGSPDRLRDSFRRLMQQYGDNISLQEFVRRACGGSGLELDPQTLAAAARAFGRALMAGQVLYDDARAMLSSLKYRGYRLAIVSNLVVPAHYVSDHLRDLGAASYIDAIATSGDVGHAKPHPAPFRRALELLDVSPSDALAVGDSVETDIEGASAAGIPCVLLDRRDRHPDCPVPRITRLTGLNGILGEGPADRMPGPW